MIFLKSKARNTWKQYVVLLLTLISFNLSSQTVTKEKSAKPDTWWKDGIIYEIYLRSFKDSDGDGIGDLKGVTEKLDYLKELGVNILWLTPFYPSPMKDFGYDVSDYKAVDPRFGTMKDFEHLLAEAHKRGLKVMIDVVPNHTSDQHPWFKESKSSKNNPKRNWYYWKDGKEDGSEPNNWRGVLGGSAWEWDNNTKQYYYHAFLKEQPDLNLRNPETLAAVLDVLRFWLDKGVDGFRIDVMWHLIKDDLWRDNPPNPDYTDTMPDSDRLLQVFSTDQYEVHGVVRKMRSLLDQYKDRAMLGEIYLDPGRLVTYYGKNDEAHLPANFQLLFTPWKPADVKAVIEKYEAYLPSDGWPNWVIGNHDRPRLITRIGPGQTRIAAMLLLTLRGTPVMYYGDEIGMQQVQIPEDEVQDPQGLLMPGKNLSRDPQRTPMQWSQEANGGFTTGKPWLRVAPDYKVKNVELQEKQDTSLFNLYRKLISFRKKEPALLKGNYLPGYTTDRILSYVRKDTEGNAVLVVVNMSNQRAEYKPKHGRFEGVVMISASHKLNGLTMKAPFILEPNEGVIIKLK